MSALQHRRARMAGRDPDESHRVATPLELLYDLTFVVAYGLAADELAHYLAEDHLKAALFGFAFAAFAITWAWINFSWFASAYDTDDWVYRLTTMVQMGGVLVLALGLPAIFESIDEGETVDNGVMVAGYVVMRLGMVFQWGRAARQDPERRRACTTYLTAILLAQAGWVALALAHTSVLVTFIFVGLLTLVEFAGPYVAERFRGGTPLGPHHIAERYGLLVVIALGEGIIGTIAAISGLVGPEGPGWTIDVVVLTAAGIGLTFGLWWTYFVVPVGDMLAARRERSFGWGYGMIPVIASVVAVGGGLHVAAYFLEGEAKLSETGALACVVVPVAIYALGLYALYTYLAGVFDGFHAILIAITVVFLVAPLLLGHAGVSMPWCLALLALAPWVTVVGYELHGHAHNASVLERLDQSVQ